MCLLMSLFLYFFSIACIALSYEELWTTAVRGKSEPPIALIHYWKCVLPTRWVNTSAQRCRGNREYLDRKRELGLIECLRQSKGRLTPTYRHPRGGFKDQIDHLFVSPVLAEKLVSCDTGSFDRVFNAGLSDHLPIVADFRL